MHFTVQLHVTSCVVTALAQGQAIASMTEVTHPHT